MAILGVLVLVDPHTHAERKMRHMILTCIQPTTSLTFPTHTCPWGPHTTATTHHIMVQAHIS
jgi:hypothetical protein